MYFSKFLTFWFIYNVLNKLDLRLCSARIQITLDFVLSPGQSPVLDFGFDPSLGLGPRPCLVLGLGLDLGPGLGPGLDPGLGPSFLVSTSSCSWSRSWFSLGFGLGSSQCLF